MKTLCILVTALAVVGVLAQNPPTPDPIDPFPPPAPEPPAGPPAPRPATKAKLVEIRRGGAGGALDQTIEADADGRGPAKGAAINSSTRTVRMTIDTMLPRSTKTGRTLVVQISNPDPEIITDAEEDLSVMSLILRKATGGARSDDRRVALGIEVDSSVFGSSSGARNIYLEGYGALFLLGVRFPLIAPNDDGTEAKPKNTESSDWAEAREELLNAERDSIETQLNRVWVGSGRRSTEDYDEDKVERLKADLLESLKNATHIRILKPEDHITISIQGAEVARKTKSPTTRGRSDSRRSETVMTMRVKKSDVDKFADGSLDTESFRKAVSVQTYFRRGDSSVPTSIFSTPRAN
jgi:hypothetical protein